MHTYLAHSLSTWLGCPPATCTRATRTPAPRHPPPAHAPALNTHGPHPCHSTPPSPDVHAHAQRARRCLRPQSLPTLDAYVPPYHPPSTRTPSLPPLMCMPTPAPRPSMHTTILKVHTVHVPRPSTHPHRPSMHVHP
ncbi:hypothetical protein OF83DRAFT_1065024 [Amylostereum chailletii]|nr:hypothetical protein OF83DRAFT_1065024 [Amylostereum chailletii]